MKWGVVFTHATLVCMLRIIILFYLDQVEEFYIGVPSIIMCVVLEIYKAGVFYTLSVNFNQ